LAAETNITGELMEKYNKIIGNYGEDIATKFLIKKMTISCENSQIY
jgi:hypothetical protein